MHTQEEFTNFRLVFALRQSGETPEPRFSQHALNCQAAQTR
jgi:hypothetical protein